jgi:hypothetical protein
MIRPCDQGWAPFNGCGAVPHTLTGEDWGAIAAFAVGMILLAVIAALGPGHEWGSDEPPVLLSGEAEGESSDSGELGSPAERDRGLVVADDTKAPIELEAYIEAASSALRCPAPNLADTLAELEGYGIEPFAAEGAYLSAHPLPCRRCPFSTHGRIVGEEETNISSAGGSHG